MDDNRVTGEIKRQAGGMQGAVGDMTGDARMQARGRNREAEGTAENLYGQAKDAMGDVVEHASEMWDGAYDQGARLYRQGSQAVGNTDVTTLLLGLVAGYALAWMIHGQHSSSRWGSSRDRDEDHGYTRPGSRDYRTGSGRGYR